MKQSKRLIAVLLSLAMVFGMLPLSVWATDADDVAAARAAIAASWGNAFELDYAIYADEDAQAAEATNQIQFFVNVLSGIAGVDVEITWDSVSESFKLKLQKGSEVNAGIPFDVTVAAHPDSVRVDNAELLMALNSNTVEISYLNDNDTEKESAAADAVQALLDASGFTDVDAIVVFSDPDFVLTLEKGGFTSSPITLIVTVTADPVDVAAIAAAIVEIGDSIVVQHLSYADDTAKALEATAVLHALLNILGNFAIDVEVVPDGIGGFKVMLEKGNAVDEISPFDVIVAPSPEMETAISILEDGVLIDAGFLGETAKAAEAESIAQGFLTLMGTGVTPAIAWDGTQYVLTLTKGGEVVTIEPFSVTERGFGGGGCPHDCRRNIGIR